MKTRNEEKTLRDDAEAEQKKYQTQVKAMQSVEKELKSLNAQKNGLDAKTATGAAQLKKINDKITQLTTQNATLKGLYEKTLADVNKKNKEMEEKQEEAKSRAAEIADKKAQEAKANESAKAANRLADIDDYIKFLEMKLVDANTSAADKVKAQTKLTQAKLDKTAAEDVVNAAKGELAKADKKLAEAKAKKKEMEEFAKAAAAEKVLFTKYGAAFEQIADLDK